MSNTLEDLKEAVEELIQPIAKITGDSKRPNKNIVETVIETPFRVVGKTLKAFTFGLFG